MKKGGVNEPLLPGVTRRVVDFTRLPFWWPCLLTGSLFWCAAMAVSVGVTSWVLGDDLRAAWYQSHWWVCWLFFALLLFITLPLLLGTALFIAVITAVLGSRGAFPAWAAVTLVSSVLSALFWGLFFATYPFSWMLQMQLYAAIQAVALLAYALIGWSIQGIPIIGGYSFLGACIATILSAYGAFSSMASCFLLVGYPDSRKGGGLWQPVVCFWLYVLFFGIGPIQQISTYGTCAASFEPGA
jgi:hypothetical protein